jgi:hypothetical protein
LITGKLKDDGRTMRTTMTTNAAPKKNNDNDVTRNYNPMQTNDGDGEATGEKVLREAIY